jgi:hypothetical protein
LVSEGDSWFDYPMHRNIIDHIDDLDRFAIARYERAGDTVIDHMGPTLGALERVVRSERPVAILFSGGGNDIFVSHPRVKEVKVRWLYRALNDYEAGATARDCINERVWRDKRDEIEREYREVIRRIGRHVPILAHGYDYLLPSGIKARYDGFRLGGPWIRPSLEVRQVPEHAADPGDPLGRPLRERVIAHLIDDFNEMLERLEADNRDVFYHVNFREALDPVTQWHNEIHPTEAGFRILADRLVTRLDGLNLY